MPHIVIITHAYDNFLGEAYLLRILSGFWLQKGYRVSVAAGLGDWKDADLAILHVDLSLVPDAYLEASKRYPVVLNGGAIDIRKNHVSKNLVRPNDGWRGPVIVKTDLNCFGETEFRLFEKSGNGELPAELPAGSLAVIKNHRYPILNSAAEVPEAIWSHPGLVVERFLPERDVQGFWVRYWTFLGERERCRRYFSRDPIAKGASLTGRGEPVPVPDSLRAERRRLGFDYGRFDFAIFDGEAVLYDANRTPAGIMPRLTPEANAADAELASGIDAWLQP